MSFFDSKRILPAVTVGLSAKERLEELRKADATYEHNTTISIKQLVWLVVLHSRYKDEDEETEAFLRNNAQVESLKKASLTHQQVLNFHEFLQSVYNIENTKRLRGQSSQMKAEIEEKVADERKKLEALEESLRYS